MSFSAHLLDADAYPLWDKLVATSPQRSIFAERWWMDIVTRGQVRLLGCFEDNTLVAGMPIWPCSTLGVSRLRQPPLTPYWGPILRPIQGKYATQLSTETDILRTLATALADWPDITCAFHPSLNNWLPFYWNSFSQMTRYTYRIEGLAANLPVGKGLHRSIRNALNRAESHGIRLQEQVDPMIIAEMSRLSMARQELASSEEIRGFWLELSRAAQERNRILNMVATDADGHIHAGFAIVWDDRYAYDLLGGGDPQYREYGGGTLVLQQLLERAATVAPSFDFEGSMLEPVGRFFRQFGGVLTPYFGVSRASSWRLNAARAVQQWRQSHKRTKPAVETPKRETPSQPAAVG